MCVLSSWVDYLIFREEPPSPAFWSAGCRTCPRQISAPAFSWRRLVVEEELGAVPDREGRT